MLAASFFPPGFLMLSDIVTYLSQQINSSQSARRPSNKRNMNQKRNSG
jgi:hypothetical protein